MRLYSHSSDQSQTVWQRAFGRFVPALFSLAMMGGGWAAAATAPAASVAGTPAAPASEQVSVRIGIAPGVWQGLNRNDVTAAIGAWARGILKQRGIQVTVDINLFESTQELAASLAEERIDCASTLSDQFLSMDSGLQPEKIYLAANNNSCTERYILLVRQDSNLHDVKDLQSRKLIVQSSPRSSLALAWLDGLLAAHSLQPPASVLGQLSNTDKPSKAILPVFFRQADVCLVTSNAFAVAGELNPQLHKELRVLAVSPEMVPALFFFRRGHVSLAREQLEPAIVTLHESPAGMQVLTVFQCDRMVRRSLSCLATTRQILTERERLRRLRAQVEGLRKEGPAILETRAASLTSFNPKP